MSYEKQTWTDGQNKYDITEQDGTVIESDIKLVYKGTSGSPISKARMNHIEKGIEDAHKTKVDKVPGKKLTANDYTTAEKNKLAGIQQGAQVNRAISSSVSSTSTSTAASSKAVKTAYDKGNSAYSKVTSASYLRDKIKTVDGSGSGLDADFVRGKKPDNTANNIAIYNSSRRVYDSERVGGKTVNQIPGYTYAIKHDIFIFNSDEIASNSNISNAVSDYDWNDSGKNIVLPINNDMYFKVNFEVYFDEYNTLKWGFRLRDDGTGTILASYTSRYRTGGNSGHWKTIYINMIGKSIPIGNRTLSVELYNVESGYWVRNRGLNIYRAITCPMGI